MKKIRRKKNSITVLFLQLVINCCLLTRKKREKNYFITWFVMLDMCNIYRVYIYRKVNYYMVISYFFVRPRRAPASSYTKVIYLYTHYVLSIYYIVCTMYIVCMGNIKYIGSPIPVQESTLYTAVYYTYNYCSIVQYSARTSRFQQNAATLYKLYNCRIKFTKLLEWLLACGLVNYFRFLNFICNFFVEFHFIFFLKFCRGNSIKTKRKD